MKRLSDHPCYKEASHSLEKDGIESPRQLVCRDEYDAGKTTATCETHGDFAVEVLESEFGMRWVKSTCSKCSDEYETKLKNKIDELQAERDFKKFKERMFASGISKRHFGKSFDNYIADTEEKRFALKTMKYLADKVLEGECKNVILCGSVGTGKTHLCQATIRHIIENTDYSHCLMATITEIIRYYRASWNKNSDYDEEDAIKYLSNRQLLVIDEMGVQNGSENELNIIFEIINNRYENKRPTVIISNLDKSALIELLGQRIIDRLKEDGCRVLGMQWESHRETNKEQF